MSFNVKTLSFVGQSIKITKTKYSSGTEIGYILPVVETSSR